MVTHAVVDFCAKDEEDMKINSMNYSYQVHLLKSVEGGPDVIVDELGLYDDHFVGSEFNVDYIEIAKSRIKSIKPMKDK